ncbi:MAG TPA: hypothetical protein VN441_12950, partial [Syntrophomonas sp.]|nr:hypothetical protein [Syntrophomonas sp.]
LYIFHQIIASKSIFISPRFLFRSLTIPSWFRFPGELCRIDILLQYSFQFFKRSFLLSWSWILIFFARISPKITLAQYLLFIMFKGSQAASLANI